jgi:hypothetical protein
MQTHLNNILLSKIYTDEQMASVMFKAHKHVYLSKCMELVTIDYHKSMPDIQISSFLALTHSNILYT